jgi:HD-like signal output (HDOD) protein/ActR/RegA family two-component response regulator
VLFVDDEPKILDGLRRMLRGRREEWQMEFETSGAAALEAMGREPFDVVVSDMRMPGMDGAQLLSEVKRCHPVSIRIILSGYSEKESVLKCVGATHQYLSKPCDPQILKSAVDRALGLRTLLGNESLKALVAQMDSLPSLPALFQEIVHKLQDPHVSLAEIGRIVAKDIGMSAKILKLVNSAYFGLAQPITSVERAVTHLGLETITSLALSVKVFSQYDGADVPAFSAESLWDHSMRTAAFARTVAQTESLDKKAADDAFTAGMLHDAGKLVLAANVPQRYGAILERVARERISLSAAERDELGATHAEVGAYLIGLWGLPDTVVEAIAYHARPREAPGVGCRPLTAVHAADGLAHESGDGPGVLVDLEYLRSLQLEQRLPVWREACRAVAARGGDR